MAEALHGIPEQLVATVKERYLTEGPDIVEVMERLDRPKAKVRGRPFRSSWDLPMSEMVGQTCRQGCVRNLKPMSAEPRKLRQRQAPQGGRERRLSFDVLGTQVVAYGGRVPGRRVDLLDRIPDPEERSRIPGTHELGDDGPGPQSPDLVRSDVDQPKGTVSRLDHALDRSRIHAQRRRGVAHQQEVEPFRKPPPDLNRGSTPRLS